MLKTKTELRTYFLHGEVRIYICTLVRDLQWKYKVITDNVSLLVLKIGPVLPPQRNVIHRTATPPCHTTVWSMALYNVANKTHFCNLLARADCRWWQKYRVCVVRNSIIVCCISQLSQHCRFSWRTRSMRRILWCLKKRKNRIALLFRTDTPQLVP